MKQLTTIISGIAMVLLVLSCKSMDLSKKYPNMVADADPFSIGAAEVEFDRFFSQKLNRVEVEAYFHPRLNAVSLEFKFELLKYKQFWDGPARKQFAAALELYKKDFDEKKLIDKYRRTRAIYGKVKARVEWEAFKYAKTRVSNPMIEIGYRFKEKTPFFATFMRSAKEIITEEDTSSAMDSQYIYMYFTRAQAEQMVMLFDQDRLMELLKEKASEIFDKSAEEDKEAYDTPKDDYYEYGEK